MSYNEVKVIETMTLEINFPPPDNLRRFQNSLRDLPVSQRLDIMTREFEQLGEILEADLRAETPVGATGQLRDSTTFSTHIVHETQESSVFLIMAQPARNRGILYQQFVVAGRQPGTPPYSVWLWPWVSAKWQLSGYRLRQAAFRLARHIGRFGTRPNDYPAIVIANNQDAIHETAARIGRTITAHLMDFRR
tara:strand:+ start:22 stop:597 length:576 start_codon:yes stop_codon:yes gene_type:complete